MKRFWIVIALAALAGCTSMQGKFENRVACAVAGDKLFAISEYGPIGISSTIADKDRAVICRGTS